MATKYLDKDGLEYFYNKLKNNFKYKDIVPEQEKTYTNVIGTANSWAGGVFFFGSIKPTSWNILWQIKYRIRTYVPNKDQYDMVADVMISGTQNSIKNWYSNNTVGTYYPAYFHELYRMKQAGFTNGYGHALGVRFQSAYNPTDTNYKRTIVIEIYETKNCEFTFYDSCLLYASIPGTGSTNYDSYTEINYVNNGLQEQGDANDPNYYNREYYGSRTTVNPLYRYQLCLTKPNGALVPVNSVNNSIATNKTFTTESFDPFGEIFYWNSTNTYAANTNIGNGSLYRQYLADLRYSFNCGGYDVTSTLTARNPLYLVAVPRNDGMAVLHSQPLSESLPTVEDGLLYIYLGRVYEDNKPYRVVLSLNHPIYIFRDGGCKQYTPNGIVKLLDSVPYLQRATADELGSSRIGERCYDTIVGASVGENQLVQSGATSVIVQSGHKYYAKINGTESLGASTGSAITINDSAKDMVVDLSLLLPSSIVDYVYSLGSSNGIAKLREWGFLRGYQAYNAGSIESVEVTGKKVVGFNQVDIAEFARQYPTVCQMNGDELTAITDVVLYHNGISVEIPSETTGGFITYEVKTVNATSVRARIVYEDGTLEDCVVQTSSTYVTVTKELKKKRIVAVRFNWSTSGTFMIRNLCINLSSSRNGEYEPYTEQTYDYGTDTLRGIFKLDANNNLYADGDVKTADGTITRKYKKIVINGDTDVLEGASGLPFRVSLPDASVPTSTSDMPNAIADKLQIITQSSTWGTPFTLSLATNHNIYFKLSDSINTIEDAKTWLASNPITLVYELATPTTEQGDPFPSPQVCYPDGTEEYVTSNGVPVGHETRYTNEDNLNLVNGSSFGSVRQISSAIENNDYTIGQNSFVVGTGTKSTNDSQTVVGKYNSLYRSELITDQNIKYIDVSSVVIDEPITVDVSSWNLTEEDKANVQSIHPCLKNGTNDYTIYGDHGYMPESYNFNGNILTVTFSEFPVESNAAVRFRYSTYERIPDNDYAFIVGTGNSYSSRSNGFTVDWDGKIASNEILLGELGTGKNDLHSRMTYNSIQLFDDSESNKIFFEVHGSQDDNGYSKIEESFNMRSYQSYTLRQKPVLDNENYPITCTIDGNTATLNTDYSISGKVFSYIGSASPSSSFFGFNITLTYYTLGSGAGKWYSIGKRSTQGSYGNYSVASGFYTIASGHYSNASGYYTIARGAYSHAQNYYTIASSSYQSVIGKYNISDTNNTYAFIIGNGTSDSARSNALTVDWNGNLNTNGYFRSKESITINSTVIKGSSPSQDEGIIYRQINFQDSQNSFDMINRFAMLRTYINPDGEISCGLYTFKNEANSTTNANLQVVYPQTGNAYVKANVQMRASALGTGGRTSLSDISTNGGWLSSDGILGLVRSATSGGRIEFRYNYSSSVTASIEENASGRLRLYNNVQIAGGVGTGGKISSSDGVTGTWINASGNMFMCAGENAGSYIYFYYNKATSATSYIHESSSGVLTTGSTFYAQHLYAVHSDSSEVRIKVKNSLHEGNLTVNNTGSFSLYSVTKAVNLIQMDTSGVTKVRCPNGMYRPVGSVDTDGQRVGAFATPSATTLRVYAQKGTAGAAYSGYITFTGTSSSDIRLKRNIKNVEINALPLINKIEMKSFDWIPGQRNYIHQPIGMIADQIEKLDDRLVIGGGYDFDGTPNYKVIDDHYLICYLTKAIQQLTIELNKLKSQK